MTDNTVVNVYPIGDALYACTENNAIRRIDRNTLETMDTVRFLGVSRKAAGLLIYFRHLRFRTSQL